MLHTIGRRWEFVEVRRPRAQTARLSDGHVADGVLLLHHLLVVQLLLVVQQLLLLLLMLKLLAGCRGR